MLYAGKVVCCGTPQEFQKSEEEYVQQFIAAQQTLANKTNDSA